jgi:hypothetical protein
MFRCKVNTQGNGDSKRGIHGKYTFSAGMNPLSEAAYLRETTILNKMLMYFRQRLAFRKSLFLRPSKC